MVVGGAGAQVVPKVVDMGIHCVLRCLPAHRLTHQVDTATIHSSIETCASSTRFSMSAIQAGPTLLVNLWQHHELFCATKAAVMVRASKAYRILRGRN